MVNKVWVGLLFIVASTVASAQSVFINEIHYDNAGGDVNEGIEIAGPAGTNLACYSIVAYNGSTGASYSTTALSGTIDDEGCGYGAVWFNISGLQNGAPDGIALYNSCTSALIQFLSYEGSFTATNGVASGVTSTDIGVAESGTTTLTTESLQLTGSGTTYGAFTWQAPAASSNDNINSGQNFCTCTIDSEPTTAASGITISPLNCNDATISWTDGNGSSRIVVVSTAAIANDPVDGTTYAANTAYGSGDVIGANEYVVYNGSGSSVTITNINALTTYHIEIFEYNGAPCEENYLSSSTVTASFTTPSCCALAAEPTTDASAASATSTGCNGAMLSWTSGNGANRLVVMRALTPVLGTPTDGTTYNADNDFGTGDAVNASEFAIYNGSGNSVGVYGLTASTTYHIAIYEYNGAPCAENYKTGSPETFFFTTGACTTCPHLTGVLINACDGSCTEGENEIMFLNTGDYVTPVDASPVWNLSYSSTNPANVTYVDATTSNAAAITDLDNSAGCAGLFRDASVDGPIPPNSAVIVVNENICASTAFDFSALCSQGPIYVVFSTDANWGTAGNFANSTSCSGGTRYFQSDFSNLGATCTIDYNYVCANNTGTDGDFVTFNSSGGAPVSYADDDCVIMPTLLPIHVLQLSGKASKDESEVDLVAQVMVDNDIVSLTLEYTNDTENYAAIQDLPLQTYGSLYQVATSHNVRAGIHYYRLKATDISGTVTYSNTVAIETKGESAYVSQDMNGTVLHLEAGDPIQQIELMDAVGRTITTYQPDGDTTIQLPGDLPNGVYTVIIYRRSGTSVVRYQH